MTADFEIIAYLLLGFFSGTLLTILLLTRFNNREKKTITEAFEKENSLLKKRLSELEEEIRTTAEHIERMRNDYTRAMAELSRAKAMNEQMEGLVRTIKEKEEKETFLKDRIAEKEVLIRELETRISEEKKHTEEKLLLLRDAKKTLEDQFLALSEKILEEKGRIFEKRQQNGLLALLAPFKEQLRDFKQKVDSVYVHEAMERASLKKEIEALRDLNQQMSREAVNLTRALKGDKKAQGTWGELVLEKVLERSGLTRGIEYEVQESFTDMEGKRKRPDVVIHLPEEKDIVIDSKVSLVAYERYSSSEEEAARRSALIEHVRAVRAHIDSLSGKDYTSLKGVRSLDFVLMFMPIESAFVAAFKEDEDLYSYAFEKRIVVVTPSTLLATLKTIQNIWRYERQNRNAQEMFERAKSIYEKLRLFTESMERLGKQLDSAKLSYEEAMGRLMRGKGNVISQLSKLPSLGVAVKKSLPRSITDNAEIEDD